MDFFGHILSMKQILSEYGIKTGLYHYFKRLWLQFHPQHKLVRISSKYAQFPLFLRTNSSDVDVYWQVFVKREYSCMDTIRDVDLIIDCGANVGYSSAYFLSRFPKCELIAIEPDLTNFQLLKQNLSFYSNNIRLINSALWSHPTHLKMVETKYRDGRAWSRQVRECLPSERSDIEAVDIDSLIKQSRKKRVSILKIDIEGAEAVVFSRYVEKWINSVDNIVIEIHDDSAFGDSSAIFAGAISGKGFNASKKGEKMVCKRPVLNQSFTEL